LGSGILEVGIQGSLPVGRFVSEPVELVEEVVDVLAEGEAVDDVVAVDPLVLQRFEPALDGYLDVRAPTDQRLATASFDAGAHC
jgi:hypothetical protein